MIEHDLPKLNERISFDQFIFLYISTSLIFFYSLKNLFKKCVMKRKLSSIYEIYHFLNVL